MVQRVLLVLIVVSFASAVASPALAHSGNEVADVRLAQTIAGTEFTVVIRRTQQVPGPLHVDLIAHGSAPALTMRLEVRPRFEGRTARATVRVTDAGSHSAVLEVGAAGPHELALRAGGESSVLPFAVLMPRAALWEWVVYGAFAVAGLLMIGGLGAAALSRTASAAFLVGLTAIAITVAVTTALLSSQLPPAQPEGATPAVTPASGRPYAQVAVGTTPARPKAGSEFMLSMELTDGSTGLPVDDLVTHHDALAHLVVTSRDGGFFRHVHPLRVGPGRFEVRLLADRPGRHLIYLEYERADSGGQLARGEFTVARSGFGTSRAEPEGVAPALRIERAVAGRPATVEVDSGSDRLQPWLGMAGHLFVRDRDGGFLGHVHELSSMSDSSRRPDETVARYGPRLRFTFTFPRPGRYFVWVQFVRDFRITSAPFTVEVREKRS